MTNKNICRMIRPFIASIITLLFGQTAFATLSIEPDKTTRQLIKQRIAPIGKSCQQGEPCAASARALAATDNKGKGRSGQEVYNTYCSACHATGLLNAPKPGDTSIWKTKLDAAGSFDNLLANAINGVGAMPAKGTCMDCSTDEIEQAISFMAEIKPDKANKQAHKDQDKHTDKIEK